MIPRRRLSPWPAAALALALLAAALPARADRQLSPERLDVLDKRGYFTPSFKAAVHDLVETHQALAQAREDQKQLEHDLPDLQRQANEAQAKTVALRQELAKYDHPEENDFTVLEGRLNDPKVRVEDLIALAQAYVWTYPASPHEAQAQQDLALMQKKLADAQQAERDAEAARQAAHAQLVARAQAHELTLDEWRGFLHGMSQDDLVKLLGQPAAQQDNYWYYLGGWVVMPAGTPKAGLEINFEAGRVIAVDAKAPTQ
ncbi:MAG: hypothetical protein WDO13_19960 [Verrucomicrobiota bacterium]